MQRVLSLQHTYSLMHKKLALALLLVVCGTGAVHTQALSTSPVNPDSLLQTFLSTLEGSLLSLREAVDTAVNNAASVRIAEAVYMAARGAARREAGYFDPELFFTFNHTTQDQPAASFFSGASVLSTKENTASGGVRMNLPIGTSIEAS